MGEILQECIVEFRIVCETLFLTFLILKLTDVVAWSWWWIFSPILAVMALILFFLIAFIIFKHYGKKREEETVSESN